MYQIVAIRRERDYEQEMLQVQAALQELPEAPKESRRRQ
jgi:hypothetical protein